MTPTQDSSALPLILLVDDDKYLLESMAEILQITGRYRVLFARSGREGLELLERHSADLILADYLMPDMNGPEFMLRVRENTQYAQVPFIFITGLTDQETFQNGMRAGASAYLKKPFEPAELFNVIDKALA